PFADKFCHSQRQKDGPRSGRSGRDDVQPTIAPGDSWMNQIARSAVNYCLSPARHGTAINGAFTPGTYARMFPELPSFEADEAFLHALGRAGGLCDGGDLDDPAESLGETAAGGAPVRPRTRPRHTQ